MYFWFIPYRLYVTRWQAINSSTKEGDRPGFQNTSNAYPARGERENVHQYDANATKTEHQTPWQDLGTHLVKACHRNLSRLMVSTSYELQSKHAYPRPWDSR